MLYIKQLNNGVWGIVAEPNGAPRKVVARTLMDWVDLADYKTAELVATRDGYDDRVAAFLSTWKLGVLYGGRAYFDITCRSVADARDKDQLRPRANLEVMVSDEPRGKQAFLGAMLVFFNDIRGQRFLAEIGYDNLCALASKLDPLPAAIIAGLLETYNGW